jgi:hypothetical protein
LQAANDAGLIPNNLKSADMMEPIFLIDHSLRLVHQTEQQIRFLL